MTRSRRGRGGHGGGGGGGGGHGGGDARWLVTYADLLTLLMVLFLVLWVISTIDAKKFEKFKEGLGDFGNPAAVADAKGQTEVVNQSPYTLGEYNGSTTTSTTIEGDSVPGASDVVTPDSVLGASQLGDLVDGLQAAVDAAGLGGVVMVKMDQRGLVISVSTDDVLFEPGSAALGPEAESIIGTVAPDLVGFGNDIIVEGYTDKRPLHRQGYDNWDLSVDRAVSVLKLLRDAPGMEPARLAATGYGDQHPLDDGDTEDAYAKNRRVEIVVVAGPAESGQTPDTPASATTTTVGA